MIAPLGGFASEPEINRNHIIDMDKVAGLLAFPPTIPGAKKTDEPFGAPLAHLMKCHRSHSAFVLFAGAVNIEISKTDHGRWQSRRPSRPNLLSDNLVEQELRITVNIQRMLMFGAL